MRERYGQPPTKLGVLCDEHFGEWVADHVDETIVALTDDSRRRRPQGLRHEPDEPERRQRHRHRVRYWTTGTSAVEVEMPWVPKLRDPYRPWLVNWTAWLARRGPFVLGLTKLQLEDLVLYLTAGLAQADIATLRGVRQQTIGERIRTARQKLRGAGWWVPSEREVRTIRRRMRRHKPTVIYTDKPLDRFTTHTRGINVGRSARLRRAEFQNLLEIENGCNAIRRGDLPTGEACKGAVNGGVYIEPQQMAA